VRTHLGGAVWRGTVLKQQQRHIDMVVVGGDMQWGQTVLALYIRVGLFLQQ